MTKEYRKLTNPLLVLFILVTGLLFAFRTILGGIKVDAIVVMGANLFLFLACSLNIYSQYKNVNNPNPNVMVRGVMGGMFVKLFGLAAIVLIYLYAAGTRRSVNAVFAGMGLYIIYAWLEVRISLRLKPKK